MIIDWTNNTSFSGVGYSFGTQHTPDISGLNFKDFLNKSESEKVYIAELKIAKTSGGSIIEKTLYLGTHPKIFNNIYYIPCITGVPKLTRKIQSVFMGQTMITWGKLVLNYVPTEYVINYDGDFITFADFLTEWVVKGRDIVIRLGGNELNYSDYGIIFTGKMDSVSWTEKQITITIYDIQKKIKDIIISSNTFAAGSNMPERTVGKTKPVCFGYVKNITPIMINTNKKQYQVHDVNIGGALEDITAVYDNGISVPFTKQLSTGCFVMTNTPSGRVTCDVKGSQFSSVFQYTAGGIIEGLLLDPNAGGLTTSDIDSVMMTTFKSAMPYKLGAYFSKSTSLLKIFDTLTIGLPVWYGFSRLGKFQIAEFAEPAGTAIGEITDFEIISNSFKADIEKVLYWKIIQGYAKDYSFRAQYSFETPYAYEIVSDSDITDLYLNAVIWDYAKSELYESADALIVAQKWLDLLGEKRIIISITCKSILFQYEMGDIIQLNSNKLSINQKFCIIGLEENYIKNTIRLTLWG